MSKIKESNKFIKDLKDKSEKGWLIDTPSYEILAELIIPALDRLQDALNELEEKLSVHDQEKFK